MQAGADGDDRAEESDGAVPEAEGALATGVQANQALAAGQVDWAGGGVESTVVAWATGLPFKVYGMYAKGGDSYGLLVRKSSNIKTPADLKGKKVAVPQGTAPAQGLSQVMQAAGLARDAVQRVNANYGNMGQMLVSGNVDAMAGLEPFLTLTAEKLGSEGEIIMRQGSSWTQPPKIKHKINDYSEDAELLEIILPADFETEELTG